MTGAGTNASRELFDESGHILHYSATGVWHQPGVAGMSRSPRPMLAEENLV
jgi:hypothetical protein